MCVCVCGHMCAFKHGFLLLILLIKIIIVVMSVVPNLADKGAHSALYNMYVHACREILLNLR